MPKANKKNLYLDKPSKSRGYMSGNDVTWTGLDTSEHIYEYLKSMGLIKEESVLEGKVRKIVKKS